MFGIDTTWHQMRSLLFRDRPIIIEGNMDKRIVFVAQAVRRIAMHFGEPLDMHGVTEEADLSQVED